MVAECDPHDIKAKSNGGEDRCERLGVGNTLPQLLR